MRSNEGYNTKGYVVQNRSLTSAMGLDDFLYTPPWRDANSFRRTQATAVLDGSVDPRYTYTTTPTNIDFPTGDAASWSVPFLHGLDYKPIVQGSFYWGGDGDLRRVMPYTLMNGQSPTSYASIGLYIGIEHVDDLYIHVRFTCLNDDGFTILLANYLEPFIFKFQCQREQAA